MKPFARSPLVIATALLLFGAGCATAPATGEERRQVVLEYVGHEVGTVGPFAKNGIKELTILGENDRKEAVRLIEHGAQGFLIIEPPTANLPNRIVLISGHRIVGDFTAAKKQG